MYKVPYYRTYNKGKDKISLVSEIYSKAIEILDTKFGIILNMLDIHNMLDNTLLVITSDHGEELLEHGDYDHRPKPFDEIIRIPLIVYSKSVRFSKSEKKAESEKLISSVDIPVSISRFVLKKSSPYFVGYDTFLGGNYKRKYILAEGYAKEINGLIKHDPSKKGYRNWCVRTKDWKYMKINGKELFFDLKADPYEKNPKPVNSSINLAIQEFLNDLKRKEQKIKIATTFHKHKSQLKLLE